MSLFQKKEMPITATMYTLGHQDTLLIVGLGNVGKAYAQTRHNAGFICVDEYAEREEFNPWVEKKDLKAILCAKLINGKKVILCKPTTLMNLSGEAVQAVQRFYKIRDDSTCVIYDELDLPLGTLRTAQGGSDAGHNGIKSLKEHTTDKFWRIRVGIGPKTPKEMDTADFVLQKFSKDQLQQFQAISNESLNLINEWLSGQTTPDTRKV